MILGLFRNRSRAAVLERLYKRVADAARRPEFFLDLEIPDTIEGRLEVLVLHLVLVLRRLRQLPPPAEDVAQDLVDLFFRGLDASLRETGVTDTGVPRRMRGLAEAFYGRARAYDGPLDRSDRAALAEALLRNVRPSERGADALADYVLASERGLAGADLERLLRDGPALSAAPSAAVMQP